MKQEIHVYSAIPADSSPLSERQASAKSETEVA